ncbi:peptidoglycan-binding protein [Streptomyces sp. SAS_260]|uniref:peptidoglycan-binding protein n=1 Tax=Streptomyces sp. SAS_260 TaxID=3412751 RepID=UPI00403D0013
MSEPTAPVCPECGAPRAEDGTPACSCTRRASDAHRESRTAEAAAAEDFDPLRIRPFVAVGDASESPADSAPEDANAPAGQPAVSSEDAGKQQQPSSLEELGSAAAATAELGPGPATSLPLDETAPQPSADSGPPHRRHRVVLLAGTGAVVAALVTGGLVAGLFQYQSPSRDGSMSDGPRAGLPQDQRSAGASSPATPSGTASPAQPSETTASSPGATPTATTSPITATGSTVPTGTPSSAPTTPSPSASNGQAPVLRLGDKGPEVVELQLRLRQTGLYGGAADGDYDREVESAVRSYQLTRLVLQDESGVYGTATRAALESETSEP